jgi:hypothetical protein
MLEHKLLDTTYYLSNPLALLPIQHFRGTMFREFYNM